MKKITLLFCALLIILVNCTVTYASEKDTKYLNNYNKMINKNLAADLAFSEMQIYHKIYSQDTFEDRINRLEIAIYGAIQDGTQEKRIKSLKKSVTNISAGGNGLQYNTTSLFGINSDNLVNSSWNIINNHYRDFPRYNIMSPRHMPPKHYHSHIVQPPPHKYDGTRTPNGNCYKNYSLETSIKILDD